jgi:hypothetical protein
VKGEIPAASRSAIRTAVARDRALSTDTTGPSPSDLISFPTVKRTGRYTRRRTAVLR